MLQSAVEHYQRQQRITAAALVAARRSTPAQLVQIIAALQMVAARDALAAIPLMLEEQNIDADAAAEVVPESVVGTASDGRPLDTLFQQASNRGALDLMVVTQIQDAARAAAGLGVTVRPQVQGYARMLNPPSCSRCAILAGKWFKWNDGFQRHPRCDCRHIPAQERTWHDTTVNPDDYFHSLPTAGDLDARYPDLTVNARREAGLYSQEDIFGKAGAQAVRDGADLTQVVNARRGMDTAQVFGRELTFTREGTTRRGLAFNALSERGGSVRRAEELAVRQTRNGPELRRITRERARAPRVMPESIYQIAKDRADAIRLLKLNGFIL